ncbi:hypothetical protein QBC38DRAFT_485064 [Podospora fimiseda]|uniref:DUF7708 domain-containing protein n=1 Tax=Podospora fimiseda TaxID=252190 RepID=A0AAN7BJF4_9PEZI|nr:hypothetical protein QBC38DRAFT_485064 [Podospora fimiseda]
MGSATLTIYQDGSRIQEKTESGAVPKLSHRNWYQTGVDFCYYAPAQEACAMSKERLEKLHLQDDDFRFSNQQLEPDIKPGEILDKLIEIQHLMDKKAHKKSAKASQFINNFADFADRVSSLVMVLIPESPEYKVTFGILFLLFKAVVTKKEREEALSSQIKIISERLPITKFYETIFPTNAMKTAVARIYASTMKILDEALVYFKGWRLNKLVDALLNNTSKLENLIADLEVDYKAMQELKDASHVAQTADMLDVVSDTNRIVSNLYQNFQSQTAAMSMSMELLHSKMHSLTTQTNSMINFEMTKHGRALQEVLLGLEMDATEELDQVHRHKFRLSPKDQWENNGIVDKFNNWSQRFRDMPVWISGTSGPNQDIWVTDMSIDIIRALQPQMEVTVLHAFCEFEPSNRAHNGSSSIASPRSKSPPEDNWRLTPIGLVKRLLAQLLDLHPELAYKRSDVCNTWKLQRAERSFRSIWAIFEQLVVRIPNLFIVIDRVDGCVGDDEVGVLADLVPALVDLGVRSSEITLILTSQWDPPQHVDDQLFPMFQDTRRTRDRRGGGSW